MYKLHLPHRKSGYIAAVHFQETADNESRPDWEMFYTPGLKARGEHTAAGRKQCAKTPKQQQLSLPKPAEPQTTQAAAISPVTTLSEEQEAVAGKLIGYGLAETDARKLVVMRLAACRLKVPAIAYLPEEQGQRNRAGNVRAFIERDDWQLPPAYLEAQAKAQEVRHGREKRAAVEQCPLCDAQGRRFVITEKYPRGAMKPCSHDPQIESGYPTG